MTMVKLYAARDTPEAHYICLWLEEHDVKAVVLGEYLSNARGQLPLTVDTLPAVWIDDEDIADAMELMGIYFEQSNEKDPDLPWLCPQCSETIEGQFDACWNCEALKPEDYAD